MDLFEPLRSFVSSLTEIPLTESIYLANCVRRQSYKKGEFLFQTGQKSDLIGFVAIGLVYTYYCSDTGSLYVKNFAWEGKLISPYTSILLGRPCDFTAVALEDTTLLTITGETLKQLQDRNACWERLSRKCSEALLIQREKREYEALNYRTLERYQAFQEEFAPILRRIPQHLIAAYLGINPVSLSRILNSKSAVAEL
jgi:CRP-like cAMP-binding protein